MDMLLDLLTRYGVLLVFGWVLIEQLGVPIPAFPLLLVAGSLAARGELSLPLLLLASVVACLIADYAWYTAGGRFGSRVLRLMCRLSLTPDSCVTQTENVFDRWGARSLVVAKFVPGFASVATAMAGAFRIHRGAFLLYDAAGAALWSGLGLALGWIFAPAMESLLQTLQAFGRWGIAFLAACIGIYIARKAWMRLALKRQMVMPRIAVSELQAMLDKDPRPVLLDVRKPGLWELERIPGSLHFDAQAWQSAKSSPHRHATIVVYCDCPAEASAVIIASQLRQKGFRVVHPLGGGLEAWRQAGLRVEAG
ncbi:rhodanese-like domain-containing protein [Xylophilus sp. GOD-11R]|uniref:rhodanese-like domain-containing protein n=1 Tax=Xylophilus sp. GOD-11R TaxID=3089814 RepID=UPI00298D1920|nr:rhodanese-like domain-containing protein [Xylophilus sp. GOD-11R]WPB58845.1 rhodanese-like domain-containing protein [Xylophilus sp. GOD-11R]